METNLNYTVTSTNTEEYDVIRTNLQVPHGNLCQLRANNLTTKASFIVLSKDDYITINNRKFTINDDYGEVSTETFAMLLNGLFDGVIDIEANTDNVKRLILMSKTEFIINEMSYNTKMVSGFYNDSLPIKSTLKNDVHHVIAQSAGYLMLTPILYLVSNLGSKCYDNVDKNYCNHKILMRVSNSFSANYPIINGNAEFMSIVSSNALSDIEFKLVDANKHPIRLLSPMYLSVQVDSIDSTDEDAKIDLTALNQTQEQTQEQENPLGLSSKSEQNETPN